MRPKTVFNILFVLSLLFVSIGDKILPQPLSQYSRNTRESINQYMLNFFPQKEIKNPNKRTEDALDDLEKRGR